MSLTAKLLLSPLLVAQALATRARLPRLPEAEGEREGVFGEPGWRPLSILIAGDSSAAGVGVAHQRDALAMPLAETLAERARRRVRWRLVARSGLTTAQTHELLRAEHAEAGRIDAEVVVVVTGVNDVVDQIPSGRAVAARSALANWLRNACGVLHVAFAPLPPVHHFPGLPQPLRWIAGADARRHDRALGEWAATRGDVTHVPLELELNRGVMASDGFHPGAPAYRQVAHDIALHLAQLVGEAPVPPHGAPPQRHPVPPARRRSKGTDAGGWSSSWQPTTPAR
ncbi:MAG: SGNH/GDSL hydrolase family protein [Rubrivivax sp.]|nr:SGNH/GDSL hydrolase family protein [Rubrivivax sp.]